MSRERLSIDLTLHSTNRGRIVGPTRLRHHGEPAERFCTTGKRCHATYEAALAEAERMMTAGHVERGCHQTPDHCTECGRWHVHNRVIVFRDVEAKR